MHKSLLAFAALTLAQLASSQTFTNPVFGEADPWVTREDGIYYTTGGCKGNAICVRSAPNMEGLRKGEWHTIFTAPPTGPNNSDIWAPEIHKVNGHWYLYYAADVNRQNDSHRIFVAKADTDDPLGNFSMADTGNPNGQLTITPNLWGIDPDEFTGADGRLYLTWSCSDLSKPKHPQDICLARLRDATHMDGAPVRISSPTEPWEMRTAPIEEGPVGYTRNGRTFITFSGSASWNANDYSVGLLTHSGGDMLSPGAWSKTGPIFDHHGTAYGAGSVVFVPAANGQWWTFYHAIDRLDCTPAYVCRNTRMQPMEWEPSGAPRLGYPVDPGVSLPEPSTGYRGSPAPWGPAYGDAAEGNKNGGSVVGQWANRVASTNESLSLGATWSQTFLESNPNLETYTFSTELQLAALGDTAAPRYGVYAAYSDVHNFVSVWIDPNAKTVSTYAIVGGTLLPWAACQLPPSFNPKQFHALSVQKVADTFKISMDQVVLPGACNARKFGLLNGQVGLVTEDARVRYRNVLVR